MANPLDALILQLLTAIHSLSGLPVPEQPPEIAFVPHSYLEEQVCQRPCDIEGWFPPGDTVYLVDTLDPAKDLWARGILLHELVHYVQQEEGSFGAPTDCDTWLERERDAYDIQIRWLVERRAAPRLLRRISWPYLQISCRDEDAK